MLRLDLKLGSATTTANYNYTKEAGPKIPVELNT